MDQDWLADHFEHQRSRLRSVAYRMLGSLSDADDAVQEAWIRLQRSDSDEIDNLDGWLTTVVARISLNLLRARRARRESGLEIRLPDPILGDHSGALDPEQQVLVADTVGLALFVVLETLSPSERLAFVLYDVFGVPFPEIAALLDCTPASARQLASRARRRVRMAPTTPDDGMAAQQQVVEAFFTAGRTGDFTELLTVLHPDVVLRTDVGDHDQGLPTTTVGAVQVARRAAMFGTPDRQVRLATVNGVAGAVIVTAGQPVSVMAFTVVDGQILAIDVLADPVRLAELDVHDLLDGLS
ncbi:MAG: sigma-70 family RNA polymerase sigma factor [Propionibacteriaceae bacterium]